METVLYFDAYKCIIKATLMADIACIRALASVCKAFMAEVYAVYPLILRDLLVWRRECERDLFMRVITGASITTARNTEDGDYWVHKSYAFVRGCRPMFELEMQRSPEHPFIEIDCHGIHRGGVYPAQSVIRFTMGNIIIIITSLPKGGFTVTLCKNMQRDDALLKCIVIIRRVFPEIELKVGLL